jgi:hypothetical protein
VIYVYGMHFRVLRGHAPGTHPVSPRFTKTWDR